MSEINNNLSPHYLNFKGSSIENNRIPCPSDNSGKTETKGNIVPDPGVLGRSQVKSVANQFPSVEEVADISPEVLSAADSTFDRLYNRFINEGHDSMEAYVMAAEGSKEITEIAGKRNH